MTKVRFGILSTAGIAQKQLIPAIQRASNAEVTAIASSSGVEKAKTVADKFSIGKTHDSYEKLLDDPEIDAVYIPLPNHLHKEWAITAAKKGKHILCEKPAAVNTTEVEEIKATCEEYQVIFMEAFMYHFHPQHDRVKQIIDSGEIGDVSYMRAAHSFPMKDRESNVRMKYQAGGGSLYDLGCYAIHVIRNVLQSEPETVQVNAVKDNGVDTDAYAYLTFSNGMQATFDSSFNLTDRNEYEVVGTEGRILIPRAFRPDKNGGDGLIIVEKQGVTRTETVNTDQYRDQVEHISQAILNGDRKLHNDFENTLNNIRVIDACMESIETGARVELG
ncbi:Gfo/Idh/MocA family oxidoreductase [Virgibacillus necropolis]|uniref:Gfo/Idh/MocA family protein n=1 Tax=Virgibacillus necropolis TaxID=163877 RepID=UPI0038507276